MGVKILEATEIVPLWLKNRNQRVHTAGLCALAGAYTWSNISVKEKVGLSAGGIYARGNTVAYIRKTVAYMFVA